MAGPVYTTADFALSTAPAGGFRRLDIKSGMIAFVRAVDQAGVDKPGAELQLALGDRDSDYFPIYPGSQVVNRTSNNLRVRWSVQAGITATLLIGGVPEGLEYKAVPRATLVVGDLASAIAQSRVSVDTTAGGTPIVAANGQRRRVSLRNMGGVDVFLGPNGVTAANGFPLPAGGTFETSQANAAFYGITAAGSSDVAVLEEAG